MLRRIALAIALLACAPSLHAQDGIDLHQATIYASPGDIADWPATVSLAAVHMRPSGDAREGLSFDAERSHWPDYVPPGWDGPIQYTVWACTTNAIQQWSCAGFIQMWRDRASTGAPILSDFHANWAYDATRWGAMNAYRPNAGDQMAFFLSAGNARFEGGVTSLRERSNVVVVRLPAGDVADFAFDSQPPVIVEPPGGVVPPVVVPPVVVEPPVVTPPVVDQPAPAPVPSVPSPQPDPVPAPVLPPAASPKGHLWEYLIGGFFTLLYALSKAGAF